MFTHMSQIKSLLFVCTLFVIGGCTNTEHIKKGSEIVASSNTWSITKQELLQNVAFASPTMTQGENPVYDILDLMIAEKALAIEAKDLGYTKRDSYQTYSRWITHEETIEQVFQQAILDTITVSEQEIREEIYRQAVRFSFRYLIAPTEQQAFALREVAMDQGYETALSYIRDDQTGQSLSADAFQTPLIQANQLSESFLQNIQNVELNRFSRPFQHEGQWWIVQPTNITRSPIAEDEIPLQYESTRKIIYNRKALQAGDRWIAQTMEPLGVTTKREPFDNVVEQLFFRVEGKEVTQSAIDEFIKQAAPSLLNSVLVTTSKASHTVEQVLRWMIPETIPLRTRSKEEFIRQFSDAIAITIRDQELLKTGQTMDLHNDGSLGRRVTNWQNKWLYQQRSLDLRSQEVVRSREQLREYADSLVALMNITVDSSMVEQVKKEVPPSQNDTFVQLLKQNSNRPAFPLVDVYW